ncbi:hypothetical protein G7B40_027500 [Aetokthonos hydrillicola Thurmond2011]|jgi:hypothetical protein|uniref:Uncharacterized protein n=2 Tax=Aetokthonos TaxID=1550243 RepID=A0AAP5MBR8_9CYAN|nr:hypothetical protein [Aetokthonos hydrillicola]MBO3459229.1 hypothetical protein [Aetokthonos hydrillicola CCALA 1050]MBW4584189.1 hypothetical protein [Aetokthonos hydrillicola CCALA 1050]MDR9898277.1 hypothetical protein [Aetokthonos hydrillicola Thurmond2011]
MSSNQNCKVSLSEEDLLEIYNNAPKPLSKNVTKVSIKEESLRNLHQEPIYLIELRNGNYWLILTEDGSYLLLPKSNLKINSFEYQTVKSLFECQGYQAEAAREFTLTKAARVLLTSKGEWMLEEKGILEFCNASPSSQLQAQLEQAQDEYIQLQFQLEQLRSQLNQSEYERVQLLSRLSQVEQERQHMLASLEQLAKAPQGEQISQHMQQATEDHKLFLAEMQKFYTGLNNLTFKVFSLEEHLESISKELNGSNSSVTKISSELVPIQALSKVESKSPKITNSFNHNTEEKDVDKLYNNEQNKKNLRHLVKVLPIQELIEKDSFGKPTRLFFQENVKGTYWIVTSEQKKYLLFPEHNFKVNEFNYKGLETAFTCHGNWQEEGAELKIFKPAIVKPLEEEGKEKWELVDQGVIEFTSKK